MTIDLLSIPACLRESIEASLEACPEAKRLYGQGNVTGAIAALRRCASNKEKEASDFAAKAAAASKAMQNLNCGAASLDLYVPNGGDREDETAAA